MTQNPFLISPADLAANLHRDGLSVVDASWYLPAQKRFARPEFEAAHVPGAVFFDQDAVVDPVSEQPHAFPPADVFAAAAGALGIRETDTIVVYDGLGLFSAPRVWWLFRAFGARDVRVLDGGFPAWTAAGLQVETGPAEPREPVSFEARLDAAVLADADAVAAASGDGSAQIVDARAADRFRGEVPEPRAGIRAGHIPGSRNLPFGLLAQDGRLRSPDEIRRAFEAAGVDPDGPVITSCGSGVTAAVLTLALESIGNRSTRLYDGSWTEWGGSNRPIETGPAREAAGSAP